MRKHIIALSIILTANLAQAQINFKTSYKEAQTFAKNTGKKLILMDFTATWCGPCKQMEKKVFTKPEVFNLINSKFSAVKMDVDTPEGKELSTKYSVDSVPTMIIMDTNGKVIKRIEGFHTEKELIKEIEAL